MAAAVSPSSSPRLPSPPPMAEDQIGPISPGGSLLEDHGKLLSTSTVDTGASRRIRPGTKAEDMAEGPPLVDLTEIDSAFQLTEHLKALYYHHTHPSESLTTVPIDPALAKEISEPPPGTSKEIWLYELGRFLIQKTNAIIVGLFADEPACSPATCPEMRASEWQYLCAVHDPPKSCSAIDYCCHTLDWAASSLTSSKMFPSRLNLGSGNATGGTDKMLQQQMKEITNIFRRVYRIYAHAWFQHRDMFWRVEVKTGLYILFKTVCDQYGLIQPENYTIPQEAEGVEADATAEEREAVQVPSLLKREPGNQNDVVEDSAGAGLSRGDTTKRHRHTRSDLSNSVSTVIQEEAEEEEAEQAPPTLGLTRESTALKDVADGQQDQSGDDMNEDDTPAIGFRRSDTLRPLRDDETEVGEDTVIAAETGEGNGEVTAEDTKESAESAVQSAADPDAATKSVGD